MTNAIGRNRKNSNEGTRYGLDMLEAHCATLNAYNWVKASGKRYVIAKDDAGRHYLDLRSVANA